MRKLRYQQKSFKENLRGEVQAQLNFINENSHLLDDYDLDDAYLRVVQEKFREEFEYYISSKGTVESIGFKTNPYQPWDKIVQDFKKFTKNTEGGEDTNRILSIWKQIKDYGVGLLKGKPGAFTIPSGWLDHRMGFEMLLEVLYNVVNNIPFTKRGHKDRKWFNTLWDEYKDRGDNLDNPHKNLKLPGLKNLTITKFKNGKVNVKGLNSQQLQDIQKLFGMLSKWEQGKWFN